MNTQPSRLRASTRGLVALVLLLSTILPVAATAAPLASPCAPGAAYDQACDVDHDGDVDVIDVQLSAGHWNQSGTFNPSDNNHTHLGQTWTGSNSPLKIEGSFGAPDYAALVLSNSASGGGDGLRVSTEWGDGVQVDEAGANGLNVQLAWGDGVNVSSAGNYGVRIGSAGIAGVSVHSAGDGYYVDHTGSASSYGSNAGNNGVEIGNAEDSGVYVNSAGSDGIFVCATGINSGCTPNSANNGVEIGNAEHDGVYVDSAGYYGVYVNSAGFNGVTVYSAGGYGVYVRSAGDDGVFVGLPAGDGVYANTTDANHEWGLITPDKISGSNVTFSSLTVIAQVTGEQSLSTGDVVAAVGVTDPLPDSSVSLALVRLADALTANGIVGVVEGRMALTAKPQREDVLEQEPVMELRSAEGPAQPGDYVALTVLGVAQVKVQEGAAIQPGQRLTASDVAGTVRALRTETLNGMVVSEGAPVIGTALAAPQQGKDTIPVFVTLR